MSLTTRIFRLFGFRKPNAHAVERRDLVLGRTRIHNREETVVLPEAARATHLAVMGLSGVGKSYFLENLIRQDINQQTGFVVFDVHGDLADAVVAYLAEHTRGTPDLQNRAVVVEPFDPQYSIGFNPLEPSPQVSPFIQAQELAHILRARWEAKSFGPRTEELLRNSFYTLSAHRLTILELPFLLTDPAFRAHLVRTLPEPSVADYWRSRYERLSEPMKSAFREPLLTRVSSFLSDPQIREIVGQRKSTFSFREALAKGLWVVINLSKGKLGDNSEILGSLLFTKLELEVMARAHTTPAERSLFTVYADELQNLAGRNFATLIAEARKYNVGLVAGHQFWHQLSQDMRSAMLSVGTRVFFRLNYHDARELAGELHPRELQWYISLLTRLPRAQAILRIAEQDPIRLIVSKHAKPAASPAAVEELRGASSSRYASHRAAIRREIEQRFSLRALRVTAQRLGRPTEDPFQ